MTAQDIVDCLLGEGEVTRDRLNAVYNKLYAQTDDLFKKHDPCQIHKNEKGETVCGPRGTSEPCCGGCKHLGDEGCKAHKPLTCRAWRCPSAGSMPDDAERRLWTLHRRMLRLGFWKYRGNKRQSVNQAFKELTGPKEPQMIRRVGEAAAQDIVKCLLESPSLRGWDVRKPFKDFFAANPPDYYQQAAEDWFKTLKPILFYMAQRFGDDRRRAVRFVYDKGHGFQTARNFASLGHKLFREHAFKLIHSELESWSLPAGSVDEATQNRYNPKGLHRNHRGQLLDKWGRDMEVDWDEFERKRRTAGEPLKSPKVLNPLHAAATPRRVGEADEAKIRSIMARAQWKANRLKSKGWLPRDFVKVLLGGPEAQKTVADEVRQRNTGSKKI